MTFVPLFVISNVTFPRARLSACDAGDYCATGNDHDYPRVIGAMGLGGVVVLRGDRKNNGSTIAT